MSHEMTLYAASDIPAIAEVEQDRAVRPATVAEIEKQLDFLRKSEEYVKQSAFDCRHTLLWLHDVNAPERMHCPTWEYMLKEFAGVELTHDSIYRCIRWAALESYLGGDGNPPAQITAREARAVAGLINQYDADLVKDAYDRTLREKANVNGQITIERMLETNIRNFVEVHLNALPTADPKRKLIQTGKEKPPTPGKQGKGKANGAKAQGQNTVSSPPQPRTGVLDVEGSDSTPTASETVTASNSVNGGAFEDEGGTPNEWGHCSAHGIDFLLSDGCDECYESMRRREREDEEASYEVYYQDRILQLEAAIRTFLASLEGSENQVSFRLTKERVAAIEGLRKAVDSDELG